MLDVVLTKVGEAVQADWKRNTDPDGVVSFDISQDAINYQDDAPRIVFEPTTERIVGQAGASQDKHVQPRQLFTRKCTVRAHVWGVDRLSTEQLLQALSRQSYALCWGSYVPGGGVWLKTSSTKRGNVYLLEAEYSIPIVREVDPRVPVDAYPTTGEFVEPGTI